MLSAGQRNAVLLAPLLAVAADRPFGFLVLDDPVHAFDQLRVDHLARVIDTIAECRRVVFLTHDERLKEHLLALSPDYAAYNVTRVSRSGAVTHVAAVAPWRTLLDDARASLNLSGDRRHGTTITPTDLVRGFCRMTVDDALRQFVVEAGAGRDAGRDLTELDRAATTKGRFAAVGWLHGDDAVAEARAVLAPYEDDWNRAAHGNPPTSQVEVAEIDAADRACRVLLGIAS